MPPTPRPDRSGFWGRFGIRIFDDSVPPALLAQTSAEMDARDAEPAGVYQESGERTIDEASRRTKLVDVSRPVRIAFQDYFNDLTSTVTSELHPDVEAEHSVSFLRYEVGDFFRPHRDTGDVDPISNRRVSAVLFLNGHDSNPSFEGGQLLLVPLPEQSAHGIAVDPVPGRGVLFPSTMLHEVKPVVSGRRFTVVTWYVAGQGT